MKKTEMSAEGLRILADNADSSLNRLDHMERQGQPLDMAPEVRQNLRTAVREANQRLQEAKDKE